MKERIVFVIITINLIFDSQINHWSVWMPCVTRYIRFYIIKCNHALPCNIHYSETKYNFFFFAKKNFYIEKKIFKSILKMKVGQMISVYFPINQTSEK